VSALRAGLLLVLALLLGVAAVRALRPTPEKPPPVAAPPPPAPPATLVEEVRPGERAIRIEVDDAAGLAPELGPGDRVDVLATTSVEGGAAVSRLLLENVRVLRVEEPGGSGRRGRAVVVAVRPEQAMAAAAAAGARLSLLARSPEDAEPVAVRELAYSGERGAARVRPAESGVLDRIPTGMRAVTVEVRETDGIAGVLRPGDRVDVIATSPTSWFRAAELREGAEGQVTGTRMASRTILQDVEVLATERALRGGVDEPTPVSVVTLLVSPRDAERLAVASDATSRSVLRLVGRRPDDRGRVATRGQALAELLAPPPSPRAAVEVIRGGRRDAAP